jgi:hypothetical protein
VIANNPFAELSAIMSPAVMQTYVSVMILLVVGGTLYDIVHKRSAAFFFQNWRKSNDKAGRALSGGDLLSIAGKTVVVDVLTSGEFCNQNRRIAHLMTMYGFLVYVITTVLLVFYYPSHSPPAPPLLPVLWHVGALLVCVGGYWFWFFIRADVAAEGNSPFRLMRADLFIISLLASVTFGLVWSFLQWSGSAWSNAALGLYLIASTVLFGSVPWSKFSHMFFKPAAAFEKRVSKANGYAQNLPTLTRDDPEQRARHSMELLKAAPMNMGLGIKREDPHHY